MILLAPLTLTVVVALSLETATTSTTNGSSGTLASIVSSTTLDGKMYLNKGIVGFGYILSNFRESTGDTLGGFGSAIALKRGTWRKKGGKFYASSLVQIAGTTCMFFLFGTSSKLTEGASTLRVATINYQARQHEIDFVLSPYYESANQTLEDGARSLQLQYRKTTLQYDHQHKTTSGLDPNAVREAQRGLELNPLRDPEMPVVAKEDDRLSLDVEGLVTNKDGSYWISDEYGPYIYRFSASGLLLQTIQPPAAVLPRDASGQLNFTSAVDPATGRKPNQGFESLAFDPSTSTLYAMLQSATIQDGGSSKSTSRHTRLFAYDVSHHITPRLKGEWVVPLPQSAKGNTLSCSEIHWVGDGKFLALSRDGDGRGGDDAKSKYKQADLFSIVHATDIHGTKYDDPANPISPSGVLDPAITPAAYVPFVNYLDAVQLAKFGLHNGKPDDSALVASKWESLALAPIGDPALPNDYFMITAADNDFISTDGVALGQPFDAGIDVDNQILVFRVTLPTLKKKLVDDYLGI
ncbi:hypothetical protein NLJ89_g7041 [Agrocybe chaxingu]|uniref:Phytase-like domain-containing protein n=1 Tax=Agrocybe chaxingu TaxID=84603 RepID=A0A9W8MVF4_9AGAR|nr:hypothetical protein NLJ89_g7041 [Agrocybe chaxingu]